jgi:hypothetical protein
MAMSGRYVKGSEDSLGYDKNSRSQHKHGRDGPTLTPSEKFLKDNLMKQFCHLEGRAGNSNRFQAGWDLAFGKLTDEEKAEREREWEAQAADDA